MQSNAERVHIVMVYAFEDFKWGEFGNITTYKVIFWQGYKQVDQCLNKVRLIGFLYLWSSNSHIFMFVISSKRIILASRLTNAAYFVYLKQSIVLEKRLENALLLDSIYSEIMLSCLSLLKRELTSGRFVIDMASASVERIYLKSKLMKLVALQVSLTLNFTVWWNIWKLVEYLDAFTGFNKRGCMAACQS